MDQSQSITVFCDESLWNLTFFCDIRVCEIWKGFSKEKAVQML